MGLHFEETQRQGREFQFANEHEGLEVKADIAGKRKDCISILGQIRGFEQEYRKKVPPFLKKHFSQKETEGMSIMQSMDRHVLSVKPKVIVNKQEGGDSQASSIKSPERVERVPGLESDIQARTKLDQMIMMCDDERE